MEHVLYKNIRDINMCKDFEILKVKVPIIFLGTAGFLLRREGRYFEPKETCVPSLSGQRGRHKTLSEFIALI